MNYLDGKEIMLGDQVLVDGENGVIVGIIDSNQFSAGFSDGWSYLQKGVLIKTDAFGFPHLPDVDVDLVLIKRR